MLYFNHILFLCILYDVIDIFSLRIIISIMIIISSSVSYLLVDDFPSQKSHIVSSMIITCRDLCSNATFKGNFSLNINTSTNLQMSRSSISHEAKTLERKLTPFCWTCSSWWSCTTAYPGHRWGRRPRTCGFNEGTVISYRYYIDSISIWYPLYIHYI